MYTPINETPHVQPHLHRNCNRKHTLAEGIMLPGMSSEMQQQHAQLASLAAKHHQHQLSGALNALHQQQQQQQQQQQLQQQHPQQPRNMMTGNGGLDISGGYLGDDGRPPPPPHSSLMQQQHQQHLNGAEIDGSHCHLL